MLATLWFQTVELKNMWIFIPCFKLASDDGNEAIYVVLVLRILNGKACNDIGGTGNSIVGFQLQNVT
jgi:hypothetical protein